jgi:N utilization substance protein B
MDNEMNNVTNDIEVNDIFEEEVNLTRSESREQAFQSLLTMNLLKKQ